LGFNTKKIDGTPYPRTILKFNKTNSIDYLKNLPKDTSNKLFKSLNSKKYKNKTN
jgi:hypothetical protein